MVEQRGLKKCGGRLGQTQGHNISCGNQNVVYVRPNSHMPITHPVPLVVNQHSRSPSPIASFSPTHAHIQGQPVFRVIHNQPHLVPGQQIVTTNPAFVHHPHLHPQIVMTHFPQNFNNPSQNYNNPQQKPPSQPSLTTPPPSSLPSNKSITKTFSFQDIPPPPPPSKPTPTFFPS